MNIGYFWIFLYVINITFQACRDHFSGLGIKGCLYIIHVKKGQEPSPATVPLTGKEEKRKAISIEYIWQKKKHLAVLVCPQLPLISLRRDCTNYVK